MCPRCAIQSWKKAAIKPGEMCGWNSDWESSDFQTRQRHRRRGRQVGDGSFSVNRGEDLEYFSYCPQLCHLSVSQLNTDVWVWERSSFWREFWVETTTMLWSVQSAAQFHFLFRLFMTQIHGETTIYILNILPLFKATTKNDIGVNKSLLSYVIRDTSMIREHSEDEGLQSFQSLFLAGLLHTQYYYLIHTVLGICFRKRHFR